MILRGVVLLVLLGAAGGLFARRALLLARIVRLGRPVDRSGDVGARLGREATQVLGQRKLFQRALPGIMHALIFWGFLVLLTTIVEAMGQAVDLDFAIPWIGRSGWLGLLQDVFAGGVLVGLAIAVAIRLGQRPERFVGSHRRDAYRILGLIFWIVATLLLYGGARIAAGIEESPAAWTPLSAAASHAFTWMTPGSQRFFVWAFLWLHLAIVLGFLVYLPHSKHLHIATAR